MNWWVWLLVIGLWGCGANHPGLQSAEFRQGSIHIRSDMLRLLQADPRAPAWAWTTVPSLRPLPTCVPSIDDIEVHPTGLAEAWSYVRGQSPDSGAWQFLQYAYEDRAQSQAEMGRCTDALRSRTSAVAIARWRSEPDEGGWRLRTHWQCNVGRGDIAMRAGRWPLARRQYGLALAALQAVGTDAAFERCIVLTKLGDAALEERNWALAHPRYTEALVALKAFARTTPRRWLGARSILQIQRAQVAWKMGDAAGARRAYLANIDAARDAFEAEPTEERRRIALGRAHARLGDFLAARGDRIRARHHFQQAIRFVPPIEDVTSATKLADLALVDDEIALARTHYQAVVEVLTKRDQRPGASGRVTEARLSAQLRMVLVEAWAGRLTPARAWAMQTLELLTSVGGTAVRRPTPLRTRIHVALALLAVAAGDQPTARHHARSARVALAAWTDPNDTDARQIIGRLVDDLP